MFRSILSLRWRPSSRESAQSWLNWEGSDKTPVFHVDPASNGSSAEWVPIPPLPTLGAAELSAWLEERHSELHDAFLQGDNTRVSTQLSEGTERMVEILRDVQECCALVARGCKVCSSGRTCWRGLERRTTLLRRYRRGMNSTRGVEISSEEEPVVPVRNVVPRFGWR